jgi:hypothetical protein
MTFFTDNCPYVPDLFTPLTDTLTHHTPIAITEQPSFYETFVAPIMDMNPFLMIHILSPFMYMGFVALITRIITPCPNSGIMKFARKYHNIVLSVLSAAMMGMTIVGSLYDRKMWAIHSIICKSHSDHNDWIILVATIFLYSKYLEWGDTLFLHLSGKPISMLQYTHHMSTAIFVYVSSIGAVIMPLAHVCMGINCLVHIPMYWYFAFPRGSLYPFRRMITQSQLIQHAICLACFGYSFFANDCSDAFVGRVFGMTMYTMYLIYFAQFYIVSYLKKKTN